MFAGVQMLRLRQSSLMSGFGKMKKGTSCEHWGPADVACKIDGQRARGDGAFHLFCPAVEAAYGIPLKTFTFDCLETTP